MGIWAVSADHPCSWTLPCWKSDFPANIAKTVWALYTVLWHSIGNVTHLKEITSLKQTNLQAVSLASSFYIKDSTSAQQYSFITIKVSNRQHVSTHQVVIIRSITERYRIIEGCAHMWDPICVRSLLRFCISLWWTWWWPLDGSKHVVYLTILW